MGRSPGEGTGNPLQYSCSGNPMDRGTWRATAVGSQSWTRLSDLATTIIYLHIFLKRYDSLFVFVSSSPSIVHVNTKAQ